MIDSDIVHLRGLEEALHDNKTSGFPEENSRAISPQAIFSFVKSIEDSLKEGFAEQDARKMLIIIDDAVRQMEDTSHFLRKYLVASGILELYKSEDA